MISACLPALCRARLLALAFIAVLADIAAAQAAAPAVVNPRAYGLDLPAGSIAPGDGLTVSTADTDGKPTVGRIHVRVGSSAVVLLPDGQLVGRSAGTFVPTDRPFEAITQDDLEKRLAAEFPTFKIGRTKHFISAYDTSEEFALATSRILETMLQGVKGYAEVQKIPVRAPEVPLVVVMFKTEAEFQKHRRMPDGVIAYYHTLSNRIFLYEQSKLAKVRPDLAIQQSISTIAHEGAHQILHNIGIQQRLSAWPMWLSEGLAEYFAPTSTGEKMKWKGAGQVNDLRMFELEQYIKSKGVEPADGLMIEHTALAARLSSTGYASAWALTHYLAKNRRTEFNAHLREVSKRGPFEGAIDITPTGVVPSNRELFVKHFGDDLKDLENRLILHLKKQPYTDPFADMPHFVATLVAKDGARPKRLVNTFHSPALAQSWLRDAIEKLPEANRASAESKIQSFPNRVQATAYATQWLRRRDNKK